MAAENYRKEAEEDVEADEEIDESDYKTQKDAVIFAIDVGKSMLELEQPPSSSSRKKTRNDTPLVAALKCAYQIMQQRIIASPNDMMAILLFNTERTRFRGNDEASGAGGGSYPHCYLYLDLDVPLAEDVKMLKSLVEEDEDPDRALVPSDEPVNMANVLFCANQIFTTKAPNFGSRRLFIITDNDDPHLGDKDARSSAAAVRAKDLYDLGVVIELFPIGKEGRKFDVSKFYDDIIYRDPTAEADEIKHSKSGDGLDLLSSLISNINSKQTPKRACFSHLPFEIAPGLTISVKGYIPLHVQKPARTTWVHTAGDRAELAVPETSRVELADSSRTVDRTELCKAYKFGGEYVHLTLDETRRLKDWGGPVLRVIGFKPRSMIPQWASVRKPTYIFPAEDDHVGSTRVFSALWRKLLADEKVALAWFVGRVNANPVLVAIVSSGARSSDETGTTAAAILPAGLWLCTLPFADDLRDADRRDAPRAPPELTEKMRRVVGNLHLPGGVYDPGRYPNPALQWHYRILQVLALDEEVPEQGEDATVPKHKAIAKRVGGAIAEINADLVDAARVARSERAVKREAEADDHDDWGTRPPAKRSRIAVVAAATTTTTAAMSDARLRAAHDQDGLGGMKVAELKGILTSKGISPKGNKADLVKKLERWIEDNL